MIATSTTLHCDGYITLPPYMSIFFKYQYFPYCEEVAVSQYTAMVALLQGSLTTIFQYIS